MKQIYVTVITLFLLTFSFNAQAQCNYTLEVTDFFGNDWVSGNNATANAGVDVTIDGVLTTYRVLNASATGNPVTETYVISVNNMSTIDIDYRAPDLSGDGEFKLIDSEDLLVYQTPIAQVSMMDIFVGSASCPTCPVIVNPGFSGVTANEAIIDWTNGGSETQWEIEYGISPYTPGSGGQVVPASTNPFTITGLSSISTYDVYIRAVCVPGSDVSNPVGPVTFTTTESCPSPSNFSPITQTANNVQFAWDSNGNPSPNYEVNYGPTPFNQGDPSGTTAAGSFGTFASVDNLMSDTEYAFYVRYDCGMGDFSLWQGPYMTTTLISCPAISGIQANTITDSSLDISWSAGGTETEWEVEYALAGTITAPGTGQGTTVSPNPTSPSHLIDALADSSNYDVFIRAVCDPLQPDYSSWVQESFSTLCLAFTTPFSEDFETGFTVRATGSPAAADNFEEENCWSADSPSAYSWVAVATAVTGSGSTGPGVSNGNYFITEASRGGAGDVTDLISPSIDLTSLTTPAISFDYHMYGADMGTLDVVVRSGGVDTTVFTLSGEQQTDEDDPFTTVIIPIAAFSSQNIQVIFRSTRGTSFTSDMAIDNLLVLESPPCVDPYDLNVLSSTSNSADLAWSELGSTTNWDLEIGSVGFVVDSGVAIIAASSTTNPYNASGLSPDSIYEFYVRSNCGVDGTSNWVGPFEFRTRCVALTAPYFTDYESDAVDSLNNCDDFIANGTGTAAFVRVDDFISASGSNHITMSSEGGGATAELFYILPEFSDLSSDKRVRFNVNDRDNGGLEVGTMTDPSDVSTFNSLRTFTDAELTDDVYEEKIVYFNSLTTTGGFIAFKFNPNGAFDDMFIDDVNYELNPSCIAPENFQNSLSATTTADLSWDDSFAQAGYEVEYGTFGHVQGDATTLINTISGITTLNTQLTGLSPATFYSAYLKTVCGAMDESLWVGPITVRTQCDTFGLPFFETFDSTSSSEQCWTVINENADGDEWNLDNTANTFSGDQSAMMDTDFNGGDNDDYLISPAIALTGNERLVYQYRVRSASEPDDFEVLLSTTTPDIAGLTNVILPQATYSNTTYVEQVIDLSAYTGTVYLSWHVPTTIGQDGWEIFIDDVLVETIPDCTNVSAVTLDMVTDISANLSWTENEMATAWEYEYDISGFTQGSGVFGIQTSADNTMNAISGLTSSTSYDVYVRSVCATGGFSNWVGPVAFTTAPGAPQGVSCPNNDSAFAWEETFDDNSAGWTGDVGTGTTGGDWNFGRVTTTSTGTGPLAQQEGAGFVYFETSGTTGVGSIVSPAINLTNATDEAELSFFIHSFGGDPTELEVAVGTSPTGPFTPIFAFTGQIQGAQADPFLLVGAMLPASVLGSSTVHIQITGTDSDSGFAGDLALDFMRIETCGNFCSNPNSMSVTNLTTTGGDFSFVDTAGTPAGAYEYAIQLDGTGVPTAAGTAVATTSFTDSSLMPGTEYEIYYRTICNATASSDWIGPLQFSTNCLPFTAPYFTDYESDPLDGLFVCDNAVFDITTATTTPPEVEVEDLIANSGNQHIYLYNGNDTSAGVYYVMPEFSDLDATKRVRFFAYDRDNSSLEVGVMSDPNDFTTFTVVQTFLDADLPDDVYEEQTVNFNSLTTTGGHIAFRSIQTSTFDAIYLDDINYELIPSCPNPTRLVVNVPGDDNLDLSWNAGLSETEWIVEYATPDFSTGTATSVTGVMSNTNYILSGLTPNSPYEVRVSAVCSPTDISPLSNTTTARTFPAAPQGVSCTTGAPGYVWEDSFDTIATAWTGDVGTGTTGGDWNFGRTSATTSGSTGPSGPHDGVGYLFFETSSTNVGPASIVSPPINLTTGANAELELSLFIHSFGGNQTIFDVAYGTSATGPFTSVFSYVGQLQTAETDAYAEVGAMLPSSLIGQTIYIQITGTEEPGNETAFQGDFAVDLMRIQTCGSFCLAPDGVSVSAITGDSAIVDWTENGNATTWEVAVVTSGSGVPTSSGTSVTTNPYSVTALSPSTVYDVYVRADCGGGLFSDWSVVESFSTDCVAFVAPYGTTAGAPGNDFATFPGVCWGEGDNTDVATGPNGLDSDWTNVDFANDPTNVFGQAASINIWNNGGDGDWLVSPEIDLGAAGGSFTASFDVALTEFDDTFASNFGSDDQVQFLITTDGGVTWSIIETFEASDNVSATGQLETFPLNAYSGVVRFGFRATNGTVADGEDIHFFVDNFTVDGTAGVNDVEGLDFTYYPNPTDNIVDFNGQQVIDSLVVRNLLGQQLLVVNPNATSTRIDLSTFPSGMYLIEVISGEQNKTVKVLRN
ncbi:putative secreted protein (Por secretion system target) [Nonlabens xylanidelens]|uniref:Putative secreted protein (Por secretion system target) n=1 Tax=Nonlabens xylanidelens TaxID=191564 RepID=A0A2S6ILD5_9FLAO|nr:choice-of-anchor J domain-containing protein [Nonlabens xylanidelens]PPK94960.1 putative secreted protein (Por secretion system target) [Nonlabens xylanidelens]PQJ17504.1 hypothetical protein BST94_10635 [Nonlabens xylanidelens]